MPLQTLIITNRFKKINKMLTNNQENFCQLVAAGNTYAEAYEVAYPVSLKWKQNAVYVQSSILMSNSNIIVRVKELREDNKKRNQATLDEVLNEMSSWLRFDPADVMDEADCVKSIKQLPKEVRKSISEIRVQELFTTIDGGKIKIGEVKNIKFIDKRATADMFLKKFGAYITNVKIDVEDMSHLKDLLNGIAK